jgi:hypothetical protein
MESRGIRHGDLIHADTSLEVKSGDLVLVQDQDDRHLVRLEHVALVDPANPAAGAQQTWWRANDQGMLPLPPTMRVIGRLVLVLHRNPESPMIEPESYASLFVTRQWTSRMLDVAAPAFASIERDGVDRTTVFRAASPS